MGGFLRSGEVVRLESGHDGQVYVVEEAGVPLALACGVTDEADAKALVSNRLGISPSRYKHGWTCRRPTVSELFPAPPEPAPAAPELAPIEGAAPTEPEGSVQALEEASGPAPMDLPAPMSETLSGALEMATATAPESAPAAAGEAAAEAPAPTAAPAPAATETPADAPGVG